MKKEIENLIDSFSFEMLTMPDGSYIKDYSILIGDVLAKMDKELGGRNEYTKGQTYNQELIERWQNCGLNKSFQEIISETKWVLTCNYCGHICFNDQCCEGEKGHDTGYTLYDFNAKALATFLLKLFPNETPRKKSLVSRTR